MNKVFNFADNEDLLSKLTDAITKAVGVDTKFYLECNPDETHNTIRLLRGDKINSNLRSMVASDSVELKAIRRGSWEGRILIDRVNKTIITIYTKKTFDAIVKKANRDWPHYVMTMAHITNSDIEPQMQNLFGTSEPRFSDEKYQKDYDDIMGGEVGPNDGYTYLVVLYEAKDCVVTHITCNLLAKDASIAEEYDLDKFLKPDFIELTSEVEEKPSTNPDVRSLVKVKATTQDIFDRTTSPSVIITTKKEEREGRA